MLTVNDLTDEEAAQAAELLGKHNQGKWLDDFDFEGKSANAIRYFAETLEKIRG